MKGNEQRQLLNSLSVQLGCFFKDLITVVPPLSRFLCLKMRKSQNGMREDREKKMEDIWEMKVTGNNVSRLQLVQRGRRR